VPTQPVDDVRSLDPISYIRQLGLHPEDSYGFVPMRLDEGSALLYLYRDRPEYEQKRPQLPPADEPSPFDPGAFSPYGSGGSLEMDISDVPGGKLEEIVAQAQEMQRMWGGGAEIAPPTPGDPVPNIDPERLARLAKLRSSGAIDDEEYQRLLAEAGVPTASAAGQKKDEPAKDTGAPIVAQRIYPGMRMRSSTRQLDHFLPRYVETVGLSPEDVYGVFPWGTRTGSGDSMDTEWDDFWIVYRDRSEYEAAREAYANQADGKGRWPDPVIAPGLGDAPAASSPAGELEVERDRWPRKALVVKQKGSELADSLREKIAKWGYEPEDSYGFCPNFEHASIYFGWRKR
jgi:hypothetical protein